MRNLLKKQGGFTLIELLVVIAIIGILVTMGVGSYMSAQNKARDATRKSDLESIARALELYYNDYKRYPSSNLTGQILGCGIGGTSPCSDDFIADDAEYLLEMPDDSKGSYFYEVSGAGVGYRLYARLENTEDRGVVQYTSGATSVAGKYSGVPTCRASGKTGCNYGISSSNLTMPDGAEDL